MKISMALSSQLKAMTMRRDIKLFAAFALLTFALAVAANITVTRKGDYVVICDGQEISRHYTYHKALESAVNQKGTCIIEQPPMEVKVTVIEGLSYIEFNWNIPTGREKEGEVLEKKDIAGYIIERVGAIDPIFIDDGEVTRHVAGPYASGTYEFTIVTIDSDSQLSKPSKPVEVIVQ